MATRFQVGFARDPPKIQAKPRTLRLTALRVVAASRCKHGT